MKSVRFLYQVVFITVFTMTLDSPASDNTPSVPELLDKYTQALDSTQSFISSWEGITNYSSKIPKLRLNIRNARKFSRGHQRTDGRRTFSQTYSWGHVNSRRPNLSKDTPFYILTVNDRVNINYNHNRTVNDPISRGNIYYRSGDPRKGYFRTEALLGYFGNEMRLDERLKNADHISIRKEPEMINGSLCYVIEADTEYGQYTVWLDSEHGYHPTRIKSEVTEGDKFHSTNTIMHKGCNILQNVDIVRFESVDGVWVPMEQHLSGHRDFVKHDGYFSEFQAQIKRTEIVLNPDHDALGSFADPLKNPEQDPELRNGTPIKMEGGLRGVWLNGKILPDIDDVFIDELDGMANQLSLNEKPGKKELSAPELLDKFARAQHQIRSLVAKAESTVKTISGLEESTEMSQSEFSTDGLRVRHRISFWDGLKRTKGRPGYCSFLYPGKLLIEYSKQLPSEQGSVVSAMNQFRMKTLVSTDYRGSPLLGVCPGDTQRVDHMLKREKKKDLAVEKEVVGGVACYRIDAQTDCGLYRLWLDPEHDYHLAKLELERKAGDSVDTVRLSGKAMKFSMSNVRFQQINDKWIPMEAQMQMSLVNGETVLKKWNHKRTHVVLDPDHIALESFVADDIPEGTRVKQGGEDDYNSIWYQGKAVTKAKMEAIKNANQ